MRLALVAGAGIAGLVCAFVELLSMAFYGDLARAPAVPLLVPPALGALLATPLGGPAMPVAVRAAYARALLHRGAREAAAALVNELPDDADTLDLRGQLAQAAGDSPAALAAFARAGDFERAQALIDSGVHPASYAVAAALERRLAGALTGAGQAAVRARALWRLGQLLQSQASVTTARAADRVALERQSLAAYDAALALAPNEETYLLAAGRQALTLGDTAAAVRYYTRALEAVPDSADARAGLRAAGE